MNQIVPITWCLQSWLNFPSYLTLELQFISPSPCLILFCQYPVYSPSVSLLQRQMKLGSEYVIFPHPCRHPFLKFPMYIPYEPYRAIPTPFIFPAINFPDSKLILGDSTFLWNSSSVKVLYIISELATNSS